MSPLLTKILAESTQLKPQEQLQLVSYLINTWQQPPNIDEISEQTPIDQPTTSPKLNRKQLFGCMKGKIKMALDFDAPLSDFAEYM